MRPPKVLLAFKHPSAEDPSACHQGLGVTALNAALSLRELRIEAEALSIPNGEYLWKKLSSDWADYTHVVLQAPFIDAEFLGRLFRAFPSVQFSLIYHSNLGFLSQDAFAGASLPRYVSLEQTTRNFRIAANSQELASAMEAATGLPFLWLPNLYHLPFKTRRMRPRWMPPQALRIGLFGASRVLKNWLTAGVAAMIVARRLETKVEFHVSSGRDESAGATRKNLSAILHLNPAIKLIEVPWLSHDDFLRYLYGIDLLLQPSFTETFNNVTADGCFCGVPSAVSEAIDWVPGDWIAKGDSAVSLARVAVSILRDKKAPQKGWSALDDYNRASNCAWLQWLQPK